MPIKPWTGFGLLASAAWLVAGGLLASWNETWITAFRFYCFLAADPACQGATVVLVAHGGAVAGILLVPLVLGWLIAWGCIAVRRRIRGLGM